MGALLVGSFVGCDNGDRKGGPLVIADPGALASSAASSAGASAAGATGVAAPRAEGPTNQAPVRAPSRPPAAAHAQTMEFVGDIAWRAWEEGKAEASAAGKPIMLLVYADWCPKCRALAPVFADPEIEALSKKFVMIRQNGDEETPGIDTLLEPYGGYVPRIFFLKPDGTVRTEVTSGHEKFPFFYAAHQADVLKKSMRSASL